MLIKCLVKNIFKFPLLLFQKCKNKLLKSLSVNRPPKEIPEVLRDQFTMFGKIGIKKWYLNDTYSSKSPLIYDQCLINKYLNLVERKKTFYYGMTDEWLYQALDKYSIKDMSIAIYGSNVPLYEAVCIYYGANPTTIEYNKIISEDKRLKVMTVEEYDRNPVQFDAALSISSFEHDGLGRYGDPVNPEGDIKAMQKMKHVVKPGGLLFLSVPVGKDTLVWNAHRVYGSIRLPLLLQGWEKIDSFGFEKELLEKDHLVKDSSGYQPIFVLRNEV